MPLKYVPKYTFAFENYDKLSNFHRVFMDDDGRALISFFLAKRVAITKFYEKGRSSLNTLDVFVVFWV